MAEHTPGPYTLFVGPSRGTSLQGRVIEVQKDGKAVIRWTGFDACAFPKDALANARLFAAAPELLAACYAGGGPDTLDVAADWIGGHSRGTADALRRMAKAMRAAVKKARGEG